MVSLIQEPLIFNCVAADPDRIHHERHWTASWRHKIDFKSMRNENVIRRRILPEIIPSVVLFWVAHILQIGRDNQNSSCALRVYRTDDEPESACI